MPEQFGFNQLFWKLGEINGDKGFCKAFPKSTGTGIEWNVAGSAYGCCLDTMFMRSAGWWQAEFRR